jgi:hypothetical protein
VTYEVSQVEALDTASRVELEGRIYKRLIPSLAFLFVENHNMQHEPKSQYSGTKQNAYASIYT